MFGSVLIFVLIEMLYFNENVGLLSFIIAVPVFISSILKMISNGLESINDRITNFIARLKDWPGITYEMLDAVRLASKKEKNDIATKEFRRVYMRYKMMTIRHPENLKAKRTVEELMSEVKGWRKKLNAGIATTEEFLEWPNRF